MLELSGKRFGKLIAMEPTPERVRGSVVWHCVCDCGGTVDAPANQLLAGYRKSCGCLSHPPRKPYEGKQFGDLTVLSYAGKRAGIHYWHCRCVCGNELDVQQTNLQNGHSAGCGCRGSIRNNIHFIDGTNLELIRSDTVFSTNKSGVRGVHWSSRQNRWIAQITFQGRHIHLGSFQTLEEAAAARKEAEEKLFGTFLKELEQQEEKT